MNTPIHVAMLEALVRTVSVVLIVVGFVPLLFLVALAFIVCCAPLAVFYLGGILSDWLDQRQLKRWTLWWNELHNS